MAKEVVNEIDSFLEKLHTHLLDTKQSEVLQTLRARVPSRGKSATEDHVCIYLPNARKIVEFNEEKLKAEIQYVGGGWNKSCLFLSTPSDAIIVTSETGTSKKSVIKIPRSKVDTLLLDKLDCLCSGQATAMIHDDPNGPAIKQVEADSSISPPTSTTITSATIGDLRTQLVGICHRLEELEGVHQQQEGTIIAKQEENTVASSQIKALESELSSTKKELQETTMKHEHEIEMLCLSKSALQHSAEQLESELKVSRMEVTRLKEAVANKSREIAHLEEEVAHLQTIAKLVQDTD